MARSSYAFSLSRSNLAILIVIAATSISLSIFTYQSFAQTANQIAESAEDDVRRIAVRQASDIRGILENKINTVVSNLHVIANAPSVHRGEESEARVLFDTAETTIGQPLDFVAWLNSDGRLVWSSNVNASTWAQYAGVDLSSRPYFTEARETKEPYFSSVIESVDNIPRVFMSVPIVDEGVFKGIVYAGYRLDTAAQLVRNEAIDEGSESRILLLSKDGVLLHSRSPEFIGMNMLSQEVQSRFIPSSIPAAERGRVNDALERALRGESGSMDITINDVTNTVAFEPVAIDGKRFLTLFIMTPHIFAEDTAFLIAQQQNVSIITIGIIGAVAFGMAFLLLGWNKRLQIAVDTRTAELRDANKLLVEANEQLKEHDRMQKEFVNVAAHELRTPVQPLIGIAEQLLADLGDGAEIKISRPEIEMLDRNAKRLVHLTSVILEASRIEASALRLKKERVDLTEKMKAVMADTQPFIEPEKDVRIVFEPPNEGSVVVEADSVRLYEVLSNLIGNAVKFTKHGVVSVSIGKTQDGHAKVSVSDTGTGIDPEIMPRLFTRFATKSEKGTGLGLYISKGIVEAHGGRIWAENNGEGRGATFTFTLPLAKGREEIKEADLQSKAIKERRDM